MTWRRWVEEADEEQIAKRERDEWQLLMLGEDESEVEKRTRRFELDLLRMAEPTGLDMTHPHHLTTNNTDSKVDNDDREPYNHEVEGAGAGQPSVIDQQAQGTISALVSL